MLDKTLFPVLSKVVFYKYKHKIFENITNLFLLAVLKLKGISMFNKHLQIIERHDNKLKAYHRADFRRNGDIILKTGLFAAIPSLTVVCAFQMLWGDVFEFFFPGLVFCLAAALGGAAILVGLLLLSNNAYTTFDLGKETISLPDNSGVISFDKVAALQIITYIRRYTRPAGMGGKRRYALVVTTGSINPCAAEILKAVKGKHTSPLNKEIPLGYNELDELNTFIHKHEIVHSSYLFRLFSHCNEVLLWQAAKKLAKILDVPLINYCGEQISIRTPSEIGSPLKIRLAGYETFKEPREPPSEYEFVQDKEYFMLKWGQNKTSDLVFSGFCVLFGFAFMVYGFQEDKLLGFFMSIPFIGALTPFIVIFFHHGKCFLSVDESQIKLKAPYRKTYTMKLDDLEILRVDTLQHPVVIMVSDQQVFTCPLPKKHARWLGDALSKFIASL